MTTVAQREATPPAFEASASLTIADLSPSLPGPSSYISANVSLVWPYSSSTDSIALLLTEPDIRLRKNKGQVKVVFRDGVAREIAKTKVGIGDTIKLSLVGCRWEKTGETVSTPGKKIDWDLEFRDRVIFQVGGDEDQRVVVNYTGHGSSSPCLNGAVAPSDSLQTPRSHQNGVVRHEQSTIQVQLTPFKSTRKYPSGTFVDASLELFAEDDGYIVGKGRKRTKFARHSDAWSLVDSEITEGQRPDTETDLGDAEAAPIDSSGQDAVSLLPSDQADRAEEEEEPRDEAGVMSNGTDLSSHVAPLPDSAHEEAPSPPSSGTPTKQHTKSTSMVMGPPPTPLRTLDLDPKTDNANGVEESGGDRSNATTTPRLLPIASPGLPLVSPLIQRFGADVGYFPPFEGPMSQLEALGDDRRHEALQVGAFTPDHVEVNSANVALAMKENTAQSQAPNEELPVIATGAEVEQNEESHHLTSPELLDSRSISPNSDTLENPVPQSPPTSQERSTADYAKAPREEYSNLQSHEEPSSIVVEIEDDDLYGAAEDMPSSVSVQSVGSLTEEQSSADVTQQYVQQSPPVIVPEATGWSAASNAHPPAAQPTPESGPSHGIWAGKLAVDAVECRSDATYPAPPFPFKQDWHRPTGSESSNRRSSHNSQAQSLDGSVDDDDGHRQDSSVVRGNAPAQVPDPDTAPLDMQFVVSNDDLPTPQSESSETARSQYVEEVTADGRAIEGHYVRPYVEEVVTSAPGSPSIDAIDRKEPPKQLPTPDQTQRDDADQGHAFRADSAHQGPQGPSEALSPRATEEETADLDLPEELQLQKTEESATLEEFVTQTDSPLETTSYRRTSQRLSVKKSVMPVNFSSPYFSPRISASAFSSPLARKENLNSPKPGGRSLPSSPIQERTKSVLFSVSGNQVRQQDVRVTTTEQAEDGGKTTQPRNGTTTSLSYYPRLTSLHEHFGTVVDVMAICTGTTAVPQRSNAGPKDYYTTLRLVDPSLDSAGAATAVQVFRPVKNALPIAERGDAIIMRNFKVQSLNREFVLLSTETSSWAIFKTTGRDHLLGSDPIISGPPIEYGQEEASYLQSLVHWWEGSGGECSQDEASEREAENTGKDLALQESAAVSRVSDHFVSPIKPRPANRRKANRTDNASNEGETAEELLAEEDDLDELTPLNHRTNGRRASSVSTTARSVTKEFGRDVTPRRSTRSQASPSLVHELRDGTKYVDHDRRRSGSVIHELRDGVTYVDE